MKINEYKLLGDFVKGEHSAFEILFKAYYPDVCQYIIPVIRDRNVVEDIVQATFLNLWEKRALIPPEINFRSYLLRAAYNTALNYIKHQKVIANYVAEKQMNIKKSFVTHQPDFELSNRIKEAVDDLPLPCRKVFRLSREEGLKYDEIASQLGISKKTVEARMGKALKLLRGRLKDYLT